MKYAKCGICGKLYVVGTSHYHIINVSNGNRGGRRKGGERPIQC